MLSAPGFIEQLASQFQSESPVALRLQPVTKSILRKHNHHQATSRVPLAGTLVDDADVFGTRKCRCHVDVEERRDPFDLCERSMLQFLVLEALTEQVETG